MSSSAPYANTNTGGDCDQVKGGRRKYESNSQVVPPPFAQNYPDAEDDTPKKHAGRRRYEAQDKEHESPFAKDPKSADVPEPTSR